MTVDVVLLLLLCYLLSLAFAAGGYVALPGSVSEAVVVTPQLHGPARDLVASASRGIAAELNATVVLAPIAPVAAPGERSQCRGSDLRDNNGRGFVF